jgi:hypothetical protein
MTMAPQVLQAANGWAAPPMRLPQCAQKGSDGSTGALQDAQRAEPGPGVRGAATRVGGTTAADGSGRPP